MKKAHVIAAVRPCVVNKEKHSEFLKDKPHRQLLDLAVAYWIPAEEEDSRDVEMVTNKLLQEVNLTEPELHILALKNVNESLIFKALGKGIMLPGKVPPMICVTNKELILGAGAMASEYVLAYLASLYEKDLLILPSSTDEFMVVPVCDKEWEIEYYREVVKNANQSDLVPPEVWLSDNVYYYSRKLRKLIIV